MEPKKIKNPTGMLIMHGTVIAVVLYMAWQLVRSYRAGGAEAPSLTTLIVGLVLLVGGCVVVGLACRAAFPAGKARGKGAGAGDRAAACRSCAGESEGSGEFGRITEVLCCA